MFLQSVACCTDSTRWTSLWAEPPRSWSTCKRTWQSRTRHQCASAVWNGLFSKEIMSNIFENLKTQKAYQCTVMRVITFDIDPDEMSHRFVSALTFSLALKFAVVLWCEAENLCDDLSASHGVVRDLSLVYGGEVLPGVSQLPLLMPYSVQQAASLQVVMHLTWQSDRWASGRSDGSLWVKHLYGVDSYKTMEAMWKANQTRY